MNSNNSPSSYASDATFGTLLVYAFIAFFFFVIGRNYDRIRTNLKKQSTEKRSSKVRAAAC